MTTDTTTADILAFVPQRPTVPEAAGVTRRRYRTIWISTSTSAPAAAMPTC